MTLLITFRIWGDLGRHFGSQGVPLWCQNLNFLIKYTHEAPKNWFSERSKKNSQISLIFVAKNDRLLKGKTMLKHCTVIKNKVLEVREK